MKVAVVLLVALALASASYTSKYPLDFGKRRSIMAVMVEVENKLKSGGPLDTVQGVLNGFKAAINEEQVSHDEVYARQKTECTSELDYRRSEILDASNTLKSANSQLRQNQLQKDKAVGQLGFTEQILIQNRQHLTLIQDVRREETNTFNRAAVTFNDAINAIDDAVDISAKFPKGASLVELGRVSNQLLKHAVALGKTQDYKAVMNAFVQVTQENANEGDVERLVSLLGTLKAAIQNAFQQYSELNTESVAEFNKQKERIVDNVNRLEAQETKLQNKIEDLSGAIATQTAVAQAASNKLQRNQVLFDDATELCSVFDKEYEATTQGRREELVLVAELERLVERRFNQVADGQ